MVERAIRTLKDECVHRHRLKTLHHASHVIADWIAFYSQSRPHSVLDYISPMQFEQHCSEEA